jgi:hypothetical protein
MDFNSILMGLGGIAVALGGGAAGKQAGVAIGDKPWQKLLGPVGATALATVYQGVTGDHEGAKDLAINSVTLGVTATGVFSVLKNLKEFTKIF